jgi:hypothetical protein
VYQRLLHSVFAYGLFLEAKHPELPQIRSAMFVANLDVTNRLGNFYRAQFWFFPVISSVLIIINSLIARPSQIDYLVLIVVWIHCAVVAFCEIELAGKWPSLDQTIKNFYPDLAEALPARKGAGQLPQPSIFDDSADARMPAFLTRIRHQAIITKDRPAD